MKSSRLLSGLVWCDVDVVIVSIDFDIPSLNESLPEAATLTRLNYGGSGGRRKKTSKL